MKILALQGGGCMGALQEAILARAHGLEKFDMYIGTSIGSANAALAALGRPASVDFYNEWMPKIFKHKRLLAPLFCPMYDDTALNEALMSQFGGYMLGDVKTPLFINAFDAANNNLKVFSSLNSDDASWPLWEVVRCSVSAPTFFRAWRGCVDGGLVANNPVMCGVAGAASKMKARIEDIELFGISCGDKPNAMGQPKDRLLSIAKWIVPSLLGGSSDRMHDFFCRALPLKTYKTVGFSWEPSWSMDNVQGMKEALNKLAPQIMAHTDTLNEFLAS